ncbi:MAG: regulatory protein GemA, partial [Sphingobium sp.]
SDMTIAELGRLLDHFNKGWKGPMGHRAHIGKIKALWWSLYWLGAIEEPGDRAISAFVERQAHVSALKFLDHRKAASVIEALKSWLERVGVQWPAQEQTVRIVQATPDYTDLHAERHAVLTAIGDALRAGGALHGHHVYYLQTALGLVANHHMWSTAELDTAIRLLGRKLRRLKGKEVRD